MKDALTIAVRLEAYEEYCLSPKQYSRSISATRGSFREVASSSQSSSAQWRDDSNGRDSSEQPRVQTIDETKGKKTTYMAVQWRGRQLQDRFGTKNQNERFRAELHARRRRPGESPGVVPGR